MSRDERAALLDNRANHKDEKFDAKYDPGDKVENFEEFYMTF